MKLKKIASLALAGVMAVSMLTACGNTINDNEKPNDDQGTTTPATGYSAKLESELSDISKDKISFSDSTELNNALQYAVGHVGNDEITYNFLYGIPGNGGVRFIQTKSDDVVKTVVNDVRDALDVKTGWENTAAGTLDNIRPFIGKGNESNAAYYNKNDVNTVLVYVVDDGVNLDNAMDQIAAEINSTIENKLYDDVRLDQNAQASNVNYHYTGSVATCNRTFKDNYGVNFIAVEITRHIGK